MRPIAGVILTKRGGSNNYEAKVNTAAIFHFTVFLFFRILTAKEGDQGLAYPSGLG